MEREIDFICHECGLPVYKALPGYFQASHKCQTLEEFEEDERRRREFKNNNPKIEIRWTRISTIKKLPE